MNFEAIQHIPMSQQAHGIDPNHVVFRLRAGRDDLKHCTLFYADRACRLTPVIFSSVEMQVEAQDEWFDYFQVILEGLISESVTILNLTTERRSCCITAISLQITAWTTDRNTTSCLLTIRQTLQHRLHGRRMQWFIISSQIALPRAAALSLANHPKKSGTAKSRAENSAERCAA